MLLLNITVVPVYSQSSPVPSQCFLSLDNVCLPNQICYHSVTLSHHSAWLSHHNASPFHQGSYYHITTPRVQWQCVVITVCHSSITLPYCSIENPTIALSEPLFHYIPHITAPLSHRNTPLLHHCALVSHHNATVPSQCPSLPLWCYILLLQWLLSQHHAYCSIMLRRAILRIICPNSLVPLAITFDFCPQTILQCAITMIRCSTILSSVLRH